MPDYMKSKLRTVTTCRCSNEEIIDTIQYLSKDHHLDGVVLLYSQKDDPVIDYLEKESIPFVLVGKTDRSIHDTIYVLSFGLRNSQSYPQARNRLNKKK